MPWIPDTNGEAIHIDDHVLDTYVSLVTEAIDTQGTADSYRLTAKRAADKAAEIEADAAALLKRAATLLPENIVVQVGDWNTKRVPGKAGRREVNREAIEAHAERLPSRLLPREETVTRWPTVADIDKAADALDPDVLADLILHPNPVPDTVKLTRREAD